MVDYKKKLEYLSRFRLALEEEKMAADAICEALKGDPLKAILSHKTVRIRAKKVDALTGKALKRKKERVK